MIHVYNPDLPHRQAFFRPWLRGYIHISSISTSILMASQAVTDAHGVDAHGVSANSAQPHRLG